MPRTQKQWNQARHVSQAIHSITPEAEATFFGEQSIEAHGSSSLSALFLGLRPGPRPLSRPLFGLGVDEFRRPFLVGVSAVGWPDC